MKIFVTGESSSLFKGIDSSKFLANHDVIYSSSVNWRLGSWVRDPENYDVCIHFAHSRLNSNENVLGTRILSEQFGEKLIYISSISAHVDSKSEYGYVKYRCEEIVKFHSGVVISVGMFLNRDIRGLFQFLEKIPSYVPNTFIPFSGSPIAITSSEDFVELISACIYRIRLDRTENLKCYSDITTIGQIRRIRKFDSGKRVRNYDHIWRLSLKLSKYILPSNSHLVDRVHTIAYPPTWLISEYKQKEFLNKL